MNREQFDRESEEISLVAKGSETEMQLSKLQRHMEQQTGHLVHKYPQAIRAMANVANDLAFQKQRAAQIRAMPLILAGDGLGVQSIPVPQFQGVLKGIFK